MTNKKIFAIAFSVTIIHFVLTSVVGHYIAVRIGTQMGQVVASGLTDATEQSPQNSERKATELYQGMKNRSEDIIENWRMPLLLLSLPSKPLLNPFLKEIRENQLNRVISKEISKEQFYTRERMLDYSANFVNSLSLGLLVYLILRILKHYQMQT